MLHVHRQVTAKASVMATTGMSFGMTVNLLQSATWTEETKEARGSSVCQTPDAVFLALRGSHLRTMAEERVEDVLGAGTVGTNTKSLELNQNTNCRVECWSFRQTHPVTTGIGGPQARTRA